MQLSPFPLSVCLMCILVIVGCQASASPDSVEVMPPAQVKHATYTNATPSIELSGGIPLIESNSTPLFEEIQRKRKASSFQEWKRYADGLMGTEVLGWTGNVYKADRFPGTEQYFLDVYLDSTASLKHEDSQPDLQIFFTTDDNREWSPGQNVTVTGTVSGVNYDSGFINLIDPVVEVADQ